MTSKAATVAEYLEGLPEDRRAAIETVRATILQNLPKGYEEGMQYGMIGYFVPHSIYPAGYHCDPKQPLPFVALASQKNYMSLYLSCLYSDAEYSKEFIQAYQESGKKLDMGACCLRFKKVEDLPLELVGRFLSKISVEEYIRHYESMRPGKGKR
ncbi:MAG: DUF1801 domain-containing protein [Armatimonadetes bacterium]|nr:DUF1801 domain-containing protein [Armatimonadota bacterium]